ncbi:Uncharacterised protein [uncultured archaeon]|nr:Uncharacterised protein [uncultured archaeon]
MIIGSPRKMGNSYKIVKRIEERMITLGDVEFNYLFLRDAHLELCRGCWSCLSVGDDTALSRQLPPVNLSSFGSVLLQTSRPWAF